MNPQDPLLLSFRVGLANRRAMLEAAWNDTDVEAGLQALYDVVHRLAGAAGAYERFELHDAARQLERGVQVWLKSPAESRPPAAGLKRLLSPVWKTLLARLDSEASLI
jgi:HPt (histidine-containing phosphotransfer) domain-containing protein